MKLSEIQSDAFEDLKKSTGWGIISEVAHRIMEEECNLDDVDEKLNSEEYKVECVGRKKAKYMFKQLFDEVKVLDKQVEFSKKDLS